MDVVNILGREPAMYIGGSWVTADETRPVINPADESIIAAVPEADEEHADGRSRPPGAPSGSGAAGAVPNAGRY